MKYVCTLIAVMDLEKSKEFYCDILEQKVIQDFGANVLLSGGFALQTLETWKDFIETKEEEILFGGNDSELAFEVDDMYGFVSKLRSFGVTYVHPMKEHSWGQRVVRFYDPDKHVIEVGENMAVVVKRFIDSGLTAEETAKRMDVPMEYVNYLLTKQYNN